MGWDGVSHISSSRYKYKFLGSEYINITDNNTLDVQQSFSMSFLIKPDPYVRLSYALLSKGHPTDPSQGSISMESINGFLRVYLHSVYSYTLCYNTNNAILNTNQIIHIEVTWDYPNRQLKVYKNAVEQSITLYFYNHVNVYSSPNQMNLIRANNDNLEFGRATGKQPFIGTLYDYLYLNRVRTSTEILNYYNSIKYLGGYPNLGTIVFTSNRGDGIHKLFTMRGDGSDQTFLYSNGNHLRELNYSHDGTKIAFCNGTETNNPNALFVINADGSNPQTLRSGIPYGGTSTWNQDDSLIWFKSWGPINKSNIHWIAPDGSGYGYYVESGATGDNVNQSGGYNVQISSVYVPILSNDGTFLFTQEGLTHETHSLIRYNVNPVTRQLSNKIIIDTNIRVSYPDEFGFNGLKVSPDNTKIAYSRRESYGNAFQVWVRNIDGTNPQVVIPSQNAYGGSTFSNYFHCWSPDSQRILYMKYDNSNYQLYTANYDGTDIRNISNNPYNDIYASWKAD